MKKQFLVSLILSLAITSVMAQEAPKRDKSEVHHHHHKTVVLSDNQPIPDIDLVVYKDSLKGWNLQIKLENFEFAPEMANQENQLNKGHAHLYINGEKITRLYGDWYYLGDLPPGTNEIKVQLNTNSHESLMYQGKLIEDTEVITVN